MKKIISALVITLALSLAAFAGKPGKVVPPPASVVVSPPDYNPGDPISFSGSGFAARQAVSISVMGPYSVNLSATTDRSGHFSVDYPGGIVFPGGYYTVVASQAKSGSTATTGLVVE